jgi:hypothetical protein
MGFLEKLRNSHKQDPELAHIRAVEDDAVRLAPHPLVELDVDAAFAHGDGHGVLEMDGGAFDLSVSLALNVGGGGCVMMGIQAADLPGAALSFAAGVGELLVEMKDIAALLAEELDGELIAAFAKTIFDHTPGLGISGKILF